MNTKMIRKSKSKNIKKTSKLSIFKSQRKTFATLISLSQNPEIFETYLPSYFLSREKKHLRTLPIDKVDELVIGITNPQCKSCKPVLERMRTIGMDQEKEILLTLNGKFESVFKNLIEQLDLTAEVKDFSQITSIKGEKSGLLDQNEESRLEIKGNEDIFHSMSEIMNESKEEQNYVNLHEFCKEDKNMDFWVFGQTTPQYY